MYSRNLFEVPSLFQLRKNPVAKNKNVINRLILFMWDTVLIVILCLIKEICPSPGDKEFLYQIF